MKNRINLGILAFPFDFFSPKSLRKKKLKGTIHIARTSLNVVAVVKAGSDHRDAAATTEEVS